MGSTSVIKLNSPGGFSAPSEQLFIETRKLREKKPVVIAVEDIAASGGYKWLLGANYTYAKAGSIVESVGVFITNPGPSIPQVPDESVIRTGPQKFLGGSRRDLLRMLDQAKENFYQTVVAERGDRLRISREELLEAGIYNGNEAVRLGLVDAVGGDTDAIEKAASLAGISGYDLVDINVEVFRIFNRQVRRIIEPLLLSDGDQPGRTDINTLAALLGGAGDSVDPPNGITGMDILRRLFLPSGVEDLKDELSDFPVEIIPPRIYYLYVGPSQ